MARRFHLILLAALIYYVTLIYAAATVETLSGPLGQGATVTITYHVTGTPTIAVTLKAVDQNTKSETVISDALPPAATGTIQWTVNVPPGTYVLAINDGTGVNFSGPFQVAPATGSVPPTSSGAPTTSAVAPTTSAVAPTSSAAAPTSSAAAPTSSAASKSPSASSSAGSTGTTSSAGATTSSPSSKSSAPTSFSGYSLLVSLAVVAAVMFHLA